jgi:AbrB family looped-hinge helix DNA binding protein
LKTVKISERFQFVIPKQIRNKLGLTAGQRLQVFEKGGIIMLVPEVQLSSMKGILKGMDPTAVREKTDSG